jgi:hypothetical protein
VTSARSGHVIRGLVERLLRSHVAARKCGHPVKLRCRVGQLGVRLGDLGRQRGDLLGAHTGVDVVAIGGRGIERGPRLRHCGGQLKRRQFGHDIAGVDGVALVDLDRR